MARARIYGFDRPAPRFDMPDLGAFMDALTGTLGDIWEEKARSDEEA